MSATKSKSIVVKVSIIAALAGLLFGLDIAYVNGALAFIAKEFNLSVEQQGSVASYLLVGAAVGTLASGWLSRHFGRKKVLVLAGAIFTLSTLFTVLTHDLNIFLTMRFVAGLAVGIASFVAPLYISEISPAKIRGSLIAMYQLMITIGILLMFLSNASLESTGSWRIMLLVLVVPSAIMFFGTLTLPESPRYKALIGDEKSAREILMTIRDTPEDVDFEIKEIHASLTENKGSVLSAFAKPYFLKVAFLGIMLQCLQQFSGMNAFMYYSGEIFKTAGFTNPSVTTVVVGLVNVLTTFVAIKFVDKIGRKKIMYIGLTILSIACAVVGYLFKMQESGVALSATEQYILLVSCLCFIAGFAMSLGPVIWIVCAEIFPIEYRDLGVTISTMANWIFNAIIGEYTLVWFKNLGSSGTFWLFGGACILGFGLIKFFTPETKGITLEELEHNLRSGKKLRDLGDYTRV